jgi:hypothetical protein
MASRCWPLLLLVVCLPVRAWAGDHRAEGELGIVVNPDTGDKGLYAAVAIAVTKEGPISPQMADRPLASSPSRHPGRAAKHPWAVVFAHRSTDGLGFDRYAATFGVRYTQHIPATFPKGEALASGEHHAWGFVFAEASTGFYRSPSGKHAIYMLSGGVEGFLRPTRQKLGLRLQVGRAWLDHDDVEDHFQVTAGLVYRFALGH